MIGKISKIIDKTKVERINEYTIYAQYLLLLLNNQQTFYTDIEVIEKGIG